MLTRRELLLSSAGLLGIPRVSMGALPQGRKHLITVLAVGGWDVTFCFDPKLACTAPGGGACIIEGPEVDENPNDPLDREEIARFGEIPVVVNPAKRPAVAEFFDRWHPKAHVVNGIWTGSIAHDPCRFRILTGTPDGTRPDLATINGHTHGGDRPLGAVDLSGWSISGSLASSTGRVGVQSQIVALIDDDVQFRPPEGASFTYPHFDPSPDDEAAVQAFLQQRTESMRGVFGDGGDNDASLDDLLGSLDRASRFRDRSQDILSSLSIGKEAGFLLQVEIAVDLIENGLCHAVTLDTQLDWDTHDLNQTQHDKYQTLFTGLGALMQALEDRGLLEDTVVAVLSEMTRTPLRNSALGKDHWGHTSAMLLGSVRGDAVSGATDHLLESVPVDLESGAPADGGVFNKYDNFAAGVLELVGVDPEPWLPGVVPFRGAHPS